MVHTENVSNSGLATMLQAFAARAGVQAVVLTSSDGLPIERSGSDGPDHDPLAHDALAALSATVAQHATRLGDGVERGGLVTAVLEYAGGCVVLAGAGGGAWLAVVTDPDADLGDLLFELRRRRPALATLLA